MVGVLTVLLATQTWAVTMVDRSTMARALAWRDADVDDWQRFPSDPVPRGGPVLELGRGSLPEGTLDEVTLPDGTATALDDLLTRTETTSFIVLRDDEVLVERYPSGGDPADVATSFSVAKSFLSTLLGLAIERGDVGSIDDPVTTYVPELRDKDPRFERVTLRHLVTMSSGIHYAEGGPPWSDDSVPTYYAPDLRATALTVRVEEPPGTRWLYNNYNPLLVGLVLERATGQDLAGFMSEVLWKPLGAEADASWSVDSEDNGFAKMESGFNARPRDYARFGYLFAHEGRIGDRQVVPESWVREATARDTSGDPNPWYQYWWWLDEERPGRFWAIGNKGQVVYVDPATDVVVVRTGRDYNLDDGIHAWPSVLRDVADRVSR